MQERSLKAHQLIQQNTTGMMYLYIMNKAFLRIINTFRYIAKYSKCQNESFLFYSELKSKNQSLWV